MVYNHFSIEHTGPGPGRYRLPAGVGYQGHDPTRRIMPAFSFGKRLDNSSESFFNVWDTRQILRTNCRVV